MGKKKLNTTEILKIYYAKLAEFKREMAAIGVDVKCVASLGKWTTIVEEGE